MRKTIIGLFIVVSSVSLLAGNAFSWGCGPNKKCPTTTTTTTESTTTTSVPETTTTTSTTTTTVVPPVTTTTVTELAPPVSIVLEPKLPKFTG